MSQASTPARIFVVGVARSGTTLLQSLLAAHSRVTSFSESHFFSRHYRFVPGTRIPVLASDPRPRLREFLDENAIGEPEIPSGSILLSDAPRLGWWQLLRHGRAAARDFIDLLDRVAAARSASSWVEKTPTHLHYLALIESIAVPNGDAAFVHMIRDGADVVASLRTASRSWERAYPIRECAVRWNEDMSRSLARARSPRDHFVFYEELTAQPEETLRALLPKLGLAWEPSILRDYGAVAASLVTADEAWKVDVGRPIAPASTAAASMSTAEREETETVLRRELYERLRAASRR